jgi:hypothetical protein
MPTTRRLPHFYPEDRWIFITWTLHGALRQSQFPPPSRTLDGRAFVAMDRTLEMACAGPMYLRQDAIANVVHTSLHCGVELGHYELGSFVIMSNHVHAVLLPKVELSRLMKSLKGFTAARPIDCSAEQEHRSGRKSPTTTGCVTKQSGAESCVTLKTTQ